MATSESGTTIRRMLPDRFEHIDAALREHAAEAPAFAGKGVPGFLWGMAGEKATSALQEALDMNLFGVLALGWRKVADIRKLARESMQTPDIPITCSLSKHDIGANVLPEVKVDLHGLGVHSIPVTLDLTAEFESARLVLRNGAIEAIDSGTCMVTAQLKCAGRALHDPRKTPVVPVGRRLKVKLESPVRVVEASPPDPLPPGLPSVAGFPATGQEPVVEGDRCDPAIGVDDR